MLERLRHSFYRCDKCKGLLTSYDIIRTWQIAELMDGLNFRKQSVAICSCGAQKLSPTNLTPDEVKRYQSYWQLFRFVALKAIDGEVRVWRQAFNMVKEGADLNLNLIERLAYKLWNR